MLGLMAAVGAVSLLLLIVLLSPADVLAHSKPYWPGEFLTTASESDGHGGLEKLRVETAEVSLGHLDDLPRVNGEALYKENVLMSLPNPAAQPQKGKWGAWLIQRLWLGVLVPHCWCFSVLPGDSLINTAG